MKNTHTEMSEFDAGMDAVMHAIHQTAVEHGFFSEE